MELSSHTETPSETSPDSGALSGTDERQAVRLWLRLLGCTHRLEQALGQRLRRGFGTSLARFDYLAQLQHYPDGLRMKTLSRRLMVTGGNITGLTDQLLADGFVTREVDAKDRRSHIVRITPLGLATFECMAVAHRQWVGSLLAGVPEGDRRLLHHLLGGLAQSLDNLPAE
jgi:DNA-binding MarR family transcriptional regulator